MRFVHDKKNRLNSNSHRIKKSKSKFVIVFVILFFLGVVGYNVGTFGITGGVVGDLANGGGMLVKGDVSIKEDVQFSGNVGNLVISSTGGQKIFIEGQKFKLPEEKSEIILKDYSGKSIFGKSSLSIEGTSKSIIINGLEVGGENSLVKFDLGKSFIYDSLEVNGAYLPSGKYLATGEIWIGGERGSIKLSNDKLSLGAFYGDFEFKSGRWIFEGNIEKLKIDGAIKSSFGK